MDDEEHRPSLFDVLQDHLGADFAVCFWEAMFFSRLIEGKCVF
jgi:hypothetical protein